VKLSAYGIEIDLPRGWDGRIFRRPGADPTLHAANFPLPASDGHKSARGHSLLCQLNLEAFSPRRALRHTVQRIMPSIGIGFVSQNTPAQPRAPLFQSPLTREIVCQ